MKTNIKTYDSLIITQSMPLELLPDSHTLDNKKQIPEKDFVISRNTNGMPLSRYGDDHWDFSTYRMGKGNTKANFKKHLSLQNKKSSQLSEIHKRLLFSIIYYSSRSYSAATIIARHYVIRSLIIEIENLDIELSEISKNDSFIKHIIEKNKKNNMTLRSILDLFVDLQSIPSHIIEIPYLKQSSFDLILRAIKNNPESKQHAVIPQRLYLNLIVGVEETISEFKKIEINLFSLFKHAISNDSYARAHITQKNKNRQKKQSKLMPNFQMAIATNRLSDWSKKYNINSLTDAVKYLTQIQIITKLGIHIFTGMRDSEAYYLSFNCIKKTNFNNTQGYIISGGTSKLSGQQISTSWIATKEAARAVEAARSIAKIIFISIKNLKDFKDTESIPLFPSPTILPFICSKPKNNNPHFDYPVAKLDTASELSRIYDKFSFNLTITESDIAELYATDPCRAWHEEPSFSCGADWPLSSHQLRRSLALYAANSGLVTLPSLQKQLKHISKEMTMYYSRNSAFAPSFSKRGHISSEFSAQQDEAVTITLLKKVFSDDVRLFGVGGKALERAKNEVTQPVYFTDKAETLKKVRRGEIAYRETLLGGCIKPGACSQGSFTTITSCINCQSALFDTTSLGKIEIAKKGVELELRLASPESFEYFAAQSQLSDLIRIEKEILKFKGEI